MKKLISIRMATTGILIILSFVIIFHLLVIGGIIPFGIVWGGNITDKNQLWRMESISIAANLVMLLFVSSSAGLIKVRLNFSVARIGYWLMFFLFVLNTLGNLMSKNHLESYLFTPLTLLLSVFCLRIAAFNTKDQHSRMHGVA